MSPEIGPIRRVVGSSSPTSLASHGRRRGEERERGERHPREEHDACDVAAKAGAGEEPEQAGDEVGRHEVAHVDGPGDEVVPPHAVRSVPDPILEPDGRDVAAEEEGVGLELGPIPGGEEQAVGMAAQEVVDREHERERQPLEDDAPYPATEIRRREREQAEHDPDEQPLAPHRDPLAPHVGAQRGEIQRRRDPAQRPGLNGELDLHAPRLTRAGARDSSCRAGSASRAPASRSGGRRRA